MNEALSILFGVLGLIVGAVFIIRSYVVKRRKELAAKSGDDASGSPKG